MATPAGAQELRPLERHSLSFISRSAVTPLAPATLAARAAQPAASEPKKVTVLIGADLPFLTGYVFRGLVQEFDPKLTFQPYVDFGVALSDKATLNVGTWNSFHTGSLKDALEGSFYESDLYASLTFVTGKWKPGILYTLYTSPAGGYEGVGEDGSIGVSELAFFASYDDSGASTPLSPKFVVAIETSDTQADFGTSKGIYFEAGIKPTFKSSDDAKVTFAVPVKIGTSLKDYYETFDGEGNVKDNKFGYLQFGVNASIPLSMMTKGSWEVHGGLDFFVFPSARKVVQEGDDEPKGFKPVLSFGFSATY